MFLPVIYSSDWGVKYTYSPPKSNLLLEWVYKGHPVKAAWEAGKEQERRSRDPGLNQYNLVTWVDAKSSSGESRRIPVKTSTIAAIDKNMSVKDYRQSSRSQAKDSSVRGRGKRTGETDIKRKLIAKEFSGFSGDTSNEKDLEDYAIKNLGYSSDQARTLAKTYAKLSQPKGIRILAKKANKRPEFDVASSFYDAYHDSLRELGARGGGRYTAPGVSISKSELSRKIKSKIPSTPEKIVDKLLNDELMSLYRRKINPLKYRDDNDRFELPY